MHAVLVLAFLLALVMPAPAAADLWRWPVRGEVLTPFHVVANPFARGQHRGIDIAAAAGAHVRSACPGRVRFAGRLPGRGRAASVVCGDLIATYLELGSLAVRRGETVRAGGLIGEVAASHLQLGARRAGGGYVDPLTLLRDPAPPPLGAAPARRVRWRPPPAGAPRGATRVGAEREARPPGEWAAWGGLALVLAGTPVGTVWRRRRRARAVAVAARDPV